MFTRAFNATGLMVRIVEWKAFQFALADKRTAIAILGYHIAVVVALAGFAVLLGAGFAALQTVVGVPIAMAAVGIFLLLVASSIWIFASRRGKSMTPAMTEHEAQAKITAGEHQLRTMLGLAKDEAMPNPESPEPRTEPSPPSDSMEALDSPKVVMAAGFALLSLLGPVRLMRTVRMATALASVTALANHAISEHRDNQPPLR